MALPLCALEQSHNKLWMQMLLFEGSEPMDRVQQPLPHSASHHSSPNTLSGGISVPEAMARKVLELVAQHPHLRFAKDDKGRGALELAPQQMRDMINALFSWHGR